MNRFDAFILAGGASRRMGTDKSQLLLEGQTFIERIADTLLQVSSVVTIPSKPQKHSRHLPTVGRTWWCSRSACRGPDGVVFSGCVRLAVCNSRFVYAHGSLAGES